MSESQLEKTVEKGISFLSKLFPLQAYLYFPLLNSAFVWAVRRVKEWKEKVFAWEVWLEPGRIEVKPDEYILNFFKSETALSRAYEAEIKSSDLKALRDAFARLYPILGLEDPFLSALFDQELKSKEFRRIVKEFEERVSRAKKDIEALEQKSGLLEGLKGFAEGMLSLGLHLLSQEEVQKIIAKIIKKEKEQK
jgi:hypothetical protein